MRHFWLLASVGAIALATLGCTPKNPPVSSNNAVSFASKMEEADMAMLEADAKDSISSMLFDERTRFLEKQAFSTAVADLKTITSPEDKSYKYKIEPISDKKKGVAITASSKQPGFRSFTGVVFVLEAKSGPMTVSQICETVQPSQLAPITPLMPNGPSEKIRCPNGSRSSLELAALQ